MTTNKKVRCWYNTKMVKSKVLEFCEQFNEFDVEKINNVIKTCDFKTLRLICNAFSAADYSEYPSIFSKQPYEEMEKIKVALNNRVNEILGEYAALYYMLIESQKHEQWAGDERYKLFGYNLPPYSDRQVIKTLVILVCEYLNKPLTIENMPKIDKLYCHGPYWTLVPEVSSLDYKDWETNDKSFNTLNNYRKTECEAWYTFMNHIYNGDYKKAYAIMVRYGTHK